MTAQPAEDLVPLPVTIHAPEDADRYSRYIYNFRDDHSTGDSCVCGDAASWPNPKHNHTLSEKDDLEATFRVLRAQDAANGVTPCG